MLLAVGGEPRSVTGLVPQDMAQEHPEDVVQDQQYWDSPSNATVTGRWNNRHTFRTIIIKIFINCIGAVER